MGHFGTNRKQLIMYVLNVRPLKMLNQDINQDILSRLSETRANIQGSCPRFIHMGIAYPRSYNIFFFKDLKITQL